MSKQRKNTTKYKGKMVETVDITPTWQGVLPVYLEALEDGPEAARKPAREEIRRMAKALDDIIKRKKERTILYVSPKHKSPDDIVWVIEAPFTLNGEKLSGHMLDSLNEFRASIKATYEALCAGNEMEAVYTFELKEHQGA